MNGLNNPIKRQNVRVGRVQDPAVSSTDRKHITDQRCKQTGSKRTEKDTPWNSNHKKAQVAILIPAKTDFETDMLLEIKRNIL